MTTTMMMRSQQFHTNNQISHQIPTFGDWEYVNDLPITQYFESARAAGLIRYSNSSGECPAANTTATADVPVLYDNFNYGGAGGGGYYYDGCNYGGYNGLGNGGGDLYAVDYDKKGFGVTTGSGPTSYPVNNKKARQVREKKCPPSSKEGIVGVGVGGRTKQYSGGKVCDVTDLRRRYNTTNSKNYKHHHESAAAAETNYGGPKRQMQKNVVMVNVGRNDASEDAGIKPRFAPTAAAVSAPRKQQPKAVDEDLYKIPPHLLRSSHRKKKLGFISKCLIPCAV